MRIRIEGLDLPGSRSGPAADELRLRNVHVGVQRKSSVVSWVPATAPSAVWDLDVDVREIDELLDVGGPFVHGRPGARFIYLSWGNVDGSTFVMFRRAKLMFADIPTAMLRAAFEDPDASLHAALGLTDSFGDPRCARVRPPDIVWTVR
ncbi:DUF5990 family protein [Paractinoplanes toevensis]|uniref:Monooxygenase n=1 Tax=Paractinoplanes toevensis TaxID=571911 RepID=A0A919TF47_9ACTN|nr:DUF5990 family protein [Actinoplanes toevensis]GIM93972.1 hypothetical protein Ato02nite_057650 [Actinoplanes toevensis]